MMRLIVNIFPLSIIVRVEGGTQCTKLPWK